MRLSLRVTVATVFFIIYNCLQAGWAVPVKRAALQQLANQYLKDHRSDEYLTAIQISVHVPREKVVSVSAGTIGHDDATRVTNEHLFQIGSITKSFITAILLQLSADPSYHFSLDDPLEYYFPEYAAWRGVTVRQLMNMTSGVPSYSEDERFFEAYLANPYYDYSPQELVGFVSQQDLLFSPGTAWHYSNTNYVLLGMMIERLTHHDLAQEINTRLIKPLHLTHTYYMPEKPSATMLQRMVHGYTYRLAMQDERMPLGWDVTRHSLSWAGAAGAVVANAEDTLHWAQALLTPGNVLQPNEWRELTKLVSTKSGSPLATVTKDDPFGFGLGIGYIYDSRFNHPVYVYEGMTLASRGIYIYEPESRITIAMTLNSSVDKEDHAIDLIADIYGLIK